MTVKHTPGPWEAEELFDGETSLGISIKAGRDEVAHISGIGPQDFDNATLLAAAPDLLEALYLALPFIEDCAIDDCYKPGYVNKSLVSIKAAIAKATGEPT